MANKSIIDVDTTESITQEDLFYVNSNKSLKQIKNKNLKFDYDTHVINKPSINGIELCGGGGKSLNELGIGSSADIEDLRQTKAGAIINSARGERIAVGDSSDAFFESLKLFGKSEQIQTKGYQLFDASKIPTKAAYGATITNNGDGSFTISGSGNLTGNILIQYALTNEEAKKLFKAGRVTLNGDKTSPFIYLKFKNAAGTIKELQTIGEDSARYLDLTSEHINSEGFQASLGIYGNSGSAIVPGTVKPMLYQSGDGTWEPFTGGKPSPSMEYKQDPESSGDSGEIGINMHGYNLFDASKIQTKSAGGATVTNNGDGSFTISGSGNLSEQFQVEYQLTRKETVSLFKKGKIKGTRSAGAYDTLPYFRMIGRSNSGPFEIIDGTEITDDHLNDESFTISFDFIANKTNTIKPGTVKPMVYQDGDGTWESFQLLRSTSLSTPNGLPGLPVDSGGNYTDSNGQQWICDEMDFGRGKYVQRVRQFPLNICNPHYHTSYSSDSYYCFDLINPNNNDTKNIYKRAVLCNAFVAKNGSNMQHINDIEGISTNPETRYSEYIYIRVKASRLPGGKDAGQFRKWLIDNNVQIIEQINPIETDIPEETMTAYRKLYTNYPTTVIQNDSGAGMEVGYIADTKSYIDNKLKELVQTAYRNMANMLSLMPTNVQAEMIENDTNNILNNL